MSFLKNNKKIILASTSAVRKRLLEDAKINFDIISPTFDEEKYKDENPHFTIAQMALELAAGKAKSVSQLNPNCLVIGSDQICELNSKGINKSKNAQEAVDQLTNLNGKIHYQNNATVVYLNDKMIFKKLSRSKLKMRQISAEEIFSYINEDKPWGSAGSYKYESLGKHLFEKIDGDYFSILGLNLQALLSFLHKKNYI